MKSALFGEMNEFGRRDHAALRVAPADQRLDARHVAGVDVHDRVIVQFEFLVDQRVAQIRLMGAARVRLDTHRIVEKAPGVAALGLGAVQREVGILDELVGGRAVLGRERYPDAGADIQMIAVEIVGRRDGAEQPVGGADRGFALIALDRRDNRELVAAEPRDRVGVANAGREPLSHHLQQFVADRMAERVVDGLEQIEIEHEKREPAAVTALPRQRLVHFFQQHRAVGDPGQAVMARHEGDLRFGLFLRGDVLMDRDPAAVGHRPVIDADHAAVAHDVLGIVRLPAAGFRQTLFDVIGGVDRNVAAAHGRFEDRAHRHAGPGLLGGKAIHLAVALVRHDQAAIAINMHRPCGMLVRAASKRRFCACKSASRCRSAAVRSCTSSSSPRFSCSSSVIISEIERSVR